MKYHLAFFLGVFFSIALSAHAQDTVSIATVRSSTIIITTSGDTIGLLGVGMPKPGSASLEEARAHLEMLLSSGRVLLVADPLVPDPPIGPKPRYLYRLDGEPVNLKMVAESKGTALRLPRHSKLEEFILAERTPRSEQGSSETKARVKENPLGILPNSSSATPRKQKESQSRRETAVQCSATTQKGSRCLRTTTDPSGRCWQHQ